MDYIFFFYFLKFTFNNNTLKLHKKYLKFNQISCNLKWGQAPDPKLDLKTTINTIETF
jgi:hypothetical protein